MSYIYQPESRLRFLHKGLEGDLKSLKKNK